MRVIGVKLCTSSIVVKSFLPFSLGVVVVKGVDGIVDMESALLFFG